MLYSKERRKKDFFKIRITKSSADPLGGMVTLKIHELQVTIREKILTTTKARPANGSCLSSPHSKVIVLKVM